jgi:hypothetical protein
VVHAGPFTPEAPPEFGYQLPYPPRELYKKGLAEFDAAIRQQYGHGYVELNTQQREKMMGEFEKGEQGSIKMATIPPAALFNLLLQNVHEGYFCDPTDGGNKGMGSWKMIGFRCPRRLLRLGRPVRPHLSPAPDLARLMAAPFASFDPESPSIWPTRT